MKITLEILQDLLVMDTFITVDMYIFIVMVFLWTPLIKNQILRYVVYKPHLLLLLLLYQMCLNENELSPWVVSGLDKLWKYPFNVGISYSIVHVFYLSFVLDHILLPLNSSIIQVVILNWHLIILWRHPSSCL